MIPHTGGAAAGEAHTDFQKQFRAALDELQTSWLGLLESVGAATDRPAHLARRLDTSGNLAWRVDRVVRTEEAETAAQHVPGRAAAGAFVEACRLHGAGDEALERARRAHGEYEKMIARHAGNRETLIAMLQDRQVNEDSVEQERVRRQGYRANSASWGVQARARVGGIVMTPGATDGLADAACFGGLVGFRRLVPQVSWPVLYLRGTGANVDDVRRGLPAAGDPRLFSEFCDDPHSSIGERKEVDGTSFWLTEGRVGLDSSTTCVLRWKVHGLREQDRNPLIDLKTPVEVVVFSVLVHRSLGPTEAAAYLYSRMQGPLLHPLHEHTEYHLPVQPNLERVERVPQLSTRLVPNYGDMVRRCCEHAGFGLEEFQGYRLLMRYPPIPTIPCIRWWPAAQP